MDASPSLHEGLLVAPPARTPLLFRPLLALAGRLAGKVPMPALLLQHFPKAALATGLLELAAPGARDLGTPDGARLLAVARIVSSATSGCPFCIDMNAATHVRVGLSREELQALLSLDEAAFASLGVRSALVARYALLVSRPPSQLPSALVEALRAEFSERQFVVLATTIATVHFWSRFNQALGVPSAGFFDSVCEVAHKPSKTVGSDA